MKLAVCGSRSAKDSGFVFLILDRLRPDSVVEGGQTGVDRFARRWAESHGIPCATEEADWNAYKKAAGPIRNAKILRDHKPDAVLAFPGGRGTANMVAQAEKAGVRIIYAEQERSLALIEHFGSVLTPRQVDVLRLMRDMDEDMVFSGRHGYVGLEPVGYRTLNALLRACAVSPDSMGDGFGAGGGCSRFDITETGLGILKKAGL